MANTKGLKEVALLTDTSLTGCAIFDFRDGLSVTITEDLLAPVPYGAVKKPLKGRNIEVFQTKFDRHVVVLRGFNAIETVVLNEWCESTF